LNFLPLPQGQGSLRPTARFGLRMGTSLTRSFGADAGAVTAVARLARGRPPG